MIWTSFLIALLAVGASAKLDISDLQYNSVRAKMNEYCKLNGAEDKTDDATAAVIAFANRTSTLFDPETIKKDVRDALSDHSRIRELFRTYCAKTPQLKSNLHTLSNRLQPCYSEDERAHVELSNNGTDRLLDYLCDNGGEKISLFFTDGGMECFQMQTMRVFHCYNMYVLDVVPSIEMAKNLTVSERCDMFDNLSTCIVKALRNCSASSPADITEALLKIVLDTVPCPHKREDAKTS